MLPVPSSWTDLDPDWMTAALSAAFPGASVSEVRIGDIAAGTNRRARVHLSYGAGAGPESVFVKREGRWLHRLALSALGAVATEARLFGSGAFLPLEHPAPFAAAVDCRRLATIVVMEDVALRSAHPNDATAALTAAEVRSGLTGLAHVHAAYWDRPLPPPLGFLRPWRLRRRWAPVSFASLARALHLLRAHGHADLVPTGAGPAAVERGFRSWATVAASGPQTVLHGDPHIANTYTLPGGTVGFYDWQLVRTGNWSHDVGYFIVSSLEVAERRVSERDLLRAYLDELATAGAPAPGFEDAWSLYRRSPVYGLGAWLHTLSGGRFQPLDRCLATIERFGAAYDDHRPAR